MRALVVDDSAVFRSQLRRCLESIDGVSVIGSAGNGKVALECLEQIECDLVTLDIEMPVMDGLAFLAEKRRRGLTQPVIVFASPTKGGASRALEALAAGADDFIAKPTSVTSLEDALEGIRRELLPKLLQFNRSHRPSKPQISPLLAPISDVKTRLEATKYPNVFLETFKPRIVVIASSTGGPAALEIIFAHLKGITPKVPIMIAQHMPPNFTEALAGRLESISGVPCAEGKSGEPIVPGRIYVAPGDFHMTVSRNDASQPIVKLNQGEKRNSVRPAADFLFETAAHEYGASVAGFVLTGMGEDGKDGAIALKKSGCAVMIQNRKSSVVWGMPGSVHSAGAFDDEGDLESCSKILRAMVA